MRPLLRLFTRAVAVMAAASLATSAGRARAGDAAPGRVLVRAAAEGDLETVASQINRGVSVDSIGDDGDTALLAAIRRGRTRVVSFLLHRGADLRSCSPTAMDVASRQGYVDIVKLLIRHGVSARSSMAGGFTALHAAAAKGHVSVAEVLIDRGADVNSVAHGTSTPLHEAATNRGGRAIIELLVRAGADVEAAPAGYTPLQFAASTGNVAE